MQVKYNLPLIIVVLIIVIGSFFIILNNYNNQKKALDSSTQSVEVTYSSYISRHSNNRRHGYRSSSQKMYTPIYHYIVDGKPYVCKSNSASNLKPSNKPKTIYFDSKNPEDCMIDNGLFNVLLSLF